MYLQHIHFMVEILAFSHYKELRENVLDILKEISMIYGPHALENYVIGIF